MCRPVPQREFGPNYFSPGTTCWNCGVSGSTLRWREQPLECVFLEADHSHTSGRTLHAEHVSSWLVWRISSPSNRTTDSGSVVQRSRQMYENKCVDIKELAREAILEGAQMST